MITLFLAMAIAKPPAKAETISTSRREPTIVWFTEAVAPLEGYKADKCDHAAVDWEIPAGTRARAHLVTPDCGETYVFLDMYSSIGPRRTEWIRVLPHQVSTNPPQKPEKWGSTGEAAFVSMPSGRSQQGIPMDDPEWEHAYLFLPSEQVTVLDPDLAIVRTQGGRVVQLNRHWVDDEDRFVRDDKPERRAAVDRMVSTRGKWEEAGTLQPIPDAQELIANTKALEDRVFLFELSGASLSHPVYARDWVDPVGHRHSLDCSENDRTDDFEGCGSYQLDYSPFGAWQPGREHRVIVRFDGVESLDGVRLPKLTVLVIGPYSRRPLISDEWAPRE
ncbi:MAG: hypothetical protein KC912_17015 [Proteobacteria bacterium]|nr:hypothetical protein [Pseudomonadota bacterium]